MQKQEGRTCLEPRSRLRGSRGFHGRLWCGGLCRAQRHPNFERGPRQWLCSQPRAPTCDSGEPWNSGPLCKGVVFHLRFPGDCILQSSVVFCQPEDHPLLFQALEEAVQVWQPAGIGSLSLFNGSFQHLFFCSPLLLGNFHCFSVPPLRQPGRSAFPSAGPTSAAAALFCQGHSGPCQPLAPIVRWRLPAALGDTWHGPCQRKAEPIWADGLSYVQRS